MAWAGHGLSLRSPWLLPDRPPPPVPLSLRWGTGHPGGPGPGGAALEQTPAAWPPWPLPCSRTCARPRRSGPSSTHPVNSRHSRVQKRMTTWLDMADCVRRMARWKSFCREPTHQRPLGQWRRKRAALSLLGAPAIPASVCPHLAGAAERPVHPALGSSQDRDLTGTDVDIKRTLLRLSGGLHPSVQGAVVLLPPGVALSLGAGCTQSALRPPPTPAGRSRPPLRPPLQVTPGRPSGHGLRSCSPGRAWPASS